MKALHVWTLVLVFGQAVMCALISVPTLNCWFIPVYNQFYEVTLMKLLYLYDPESCGKIYFYNYTMSTSQDQIHSTVIWPIKNEIAKSFRKKVSLWFSLHVLWVLFYLIELSQSRKILGFYVGLLPFTVVGTALLFIDLTHMIMFLQDLQNTKNELDILIYIDEDKDIVREVLPRSYSLPEWIEVKQYEDTSWIALLMAFISCRGIVLWIINFWLIKDNFYNGFKVFLSARAMKHHHHHNHHHVKRTDKYYS